MTRSIELNPEMIDALENAAIAMGNTARDLARIGSTYLSNKFIDQANLIRAALDHSEEQK